MLSANGTYFSLLEVFGSFNTPKNMSSRKCFIDFRVAEAICKARSFAAFQPRFLGVSLQIGNGAELGNPILPFFPAWAPAGLLDETA